MQPGRAPSAPCFVANVRNVCRINKKVLISNRQQKINSQNLIVIIFLFSAIDRAEIVFHHLCFLLMYSMTCSTADGSSPLVLNCHILKHEIRHQQFSKSIQAFHTENVSIPSHWYRDNNIDM